MSGLPTHPVLWVIGNPDAPHFRLLRQLPPTLTIVIHRNPSDFASAPDPDILLNGGYPREFLQPLWPRLHKVQWIHSLMAGLESQMFPELAASPIPLTNAAGVFANSLAEFALSAILYFAKDIPRMERQRRERRWEQFDIVELRNAKLGIFGYGGIGRATARLAKSFGMKVFIVRRKSAARDEYTDVVVHPDALDDLLPELDYILISAPLTQETHARFGDAQFRRLKPSAVLINLGRGPIVVEEALLDALRQNRIKGAALDVFDTEPLPSEHPLYSLDNVLLSPHTADHTATWLDEATGLFLDNYRRFQNGEPLLNVADKSAGY